jgi:hypothetical protein
MTDDPMYQRTGVQSAEPPHLREAPRCGAKTRSGQPCRSPAVHGRPRCRMHGCAPGAGGPEGERNGNYRHGLYTKESGPGFGLRNLTREVRDLTRKLRGGVRSGKFKPAATR